MGFPASAAYLTAQLYNPLQYVYGALPQTAWKTNDTSRTSNATVTADPDLQLAVVAGATYTLDGVIFTMTPGTGSPATDHAGLTCTFGAPTGSTGRWTGLFPNTTATGDPPTGIRIASNVLNSTLTFGHPNTNELAMLIKGFVVPATNGTLSFNWAQNTSTAVNTTINACSWMSLTRVA